MWDSERFVYDAEEVLRQIGQRSISTSVTCSLLAGGSCKSNVVEVPEVSMSRWIYALFLTS